MISQLIWLRLVIALEAKEREKARLPSGSKSAIQTLTSSAATKDQKGRQTEKN